MFSLYFDYLLFVVVVVVFLLFPVSGFFGWDLGCDCTNSWTLHTFLLFFIISGISS